MSIRHRCLPAHRIYRNLLMTIFATSCFLCFTLFTHPLIMVHNNCVHCSVSNNYLQKIVHEIYINGSSAKQPINPTNIEYIHEPLHVCDLHIGPDFLLVLVKSDASNIAHRMSIRQTWGNISHPHIKVIYLLGYYSVVQDMIDIESKTYKDVLQGDFVDIYDNNMNKTAMAYQYAVENCGNTQFLFFVDDDFFINILKVNKYLKTLPDTLKSNLFSGCIIKRAKPYRNKSSKWYITREEYPYDIYPNYPSGGAILMSMTIAKLLKTAFPYVQYIHIDDAYLGIVAQKLKLPLHNDERFDVVHTPPMRLKTIFASHGYGDHRQLLVIWDVFLATMSLNSSTDLNKQLQKS
ncbi:beta-1,3-galactosyltransferase brn-like [Mytilus galloprovincialis]|uniref:Hexosyltransferase n=2 Tax=Mytilus galloprovincialis TaxID=29158 RepID=A0A8B6BEV8_MYTGA|nr:putative enzyme (brainiac) [Mytilus galloprovincialis]